MPPHEIRPVQNELQAGSPVRREQPPRRERPVRPRDIEKELIPDQGHPRIVREISPERIRRQLQKAERFYPNRNQRHSPTRLYDINRSNQAAFAHAFSSPYAFTQRNFSLSITRGLRMVEAANLQLPQVEQMRSEEVLALARLGAASIPREALHFIAHALIPAASSESFRNETAKNLFDGNNLYCFVQGIIAILRKAVSRMEAEAERKLENEVLAERRQEEKAQKKLQQNTVETRKTVIKTMEMRAQEKALMQRLEETVLQQLKESGLGYNLVLESERMQLINQLISLGRKPQMLPVLQALPLTA